MAKAPKLKVYRTPIGFHDAYVAAPSKKAALAAWGSDANLFARGVAEEVTDAALMQEPLAKPGEIVRRMRETDEEDTPPAARPEAGSPANKTKAPGKPKPGPKPRPSRDALDAAEQAVVEAEALHQAALDEIAERQKALDRERRAREQAAETELAKLRTAQDKAAAAYERALAKWRG